MGLFKTHVIEGKLRRLIYSFLEEFRLKLSLLFYIRSLVQLPTFGLLKQYLSSFQRAEFFSWLLMGPSLPHSFLLLAFNKRVFSSHIILLDHLRRM